MAPPLSPAHGGSLATTAGITSVITGVLAAALLGQLGSAPPGPLAPISMGFLCLGAWALYEARDRVGRALDLLPQDPEAGARLGHMARAWYHLGMAGVFGGLGLAAAWRLLPSSGMGAWPAILVAALAAALASARAITIRSKIP